VTGAVDGVGTLAVVRRRLLFLPGMSGDGEFWAPVADCLAQHETVRIDWPGLGTSPADPSIASYDDLVELVLGHLTAPSVLVAQSMGGYVAVQTALRAPSKVTHLVLAATSGGLDLEQFGGADWRPDSRRAHPDAPDWAFAQTPDLSAELPLITVPVLLFWATHDAISPISVGEHLARLLPHSRLVVFDCDDHWVARIHAADVAREIERFVATT
jgi:pimeloyl-ACP methyl ester carboxylesterase